MPRDYDKPKKSWREIDQGKDRSAHRHNDAPAMSPHRQARADSASKTYKSKLDAFFDGDAPAPTQIKDKLAALSGAEGGKERKEALARMNTARTSSDRTTAVKDFLAHWELPSDYEVLVEVLACSDDDYILLAMNEIEAMVGANRIPRNKPLLEQRLRSIASLSEEPVLVEKAKSIIALLRLFKCCIGSIKPLFSDLRRRRSPHPTASFLST